MAAPEGDRLFGGLTRPATVLSLPIEALLAIGGVTAIVFLVSAMFQAPILIRLCVIGVGMALYGIARLICMKDPRSFRYWALMLSTRGTHRTRGFWKSSSYSPLPHRKR